MEIIHAPSSKYYQIGQTIPIKYSLVKYEKDKIIEQHSPFLCKDYLVDCVFATHYNEYFIIYGFTANPEYLSGIDSTNFRIVFPEKQLLQNFLSTLHVLNKYESQFSLISTVIVQQEKDDLYVRADIFWTTKSWALHLYAFLLKCIAVYPEITDISELVSIWKQEQVNYNYKLTEIEYAFPYIEKISKIHSDYEKKFYLEIKENVDKKFSEFQKILLNVTDPQYPKFVSKNPNKDYIHDSNGIMSLVDNRILKL